MTKPSNGFSTGLQNVRKVYIDDMKTNTESDDKQWLALSLSSSSTFSELIENLKIETSNYLYSLKIISHNNSYRIRLPKSVFAINLGH